MTVVHYILFVGATAPLATELESIGRRISNTKIIAPAMKKSEVGASITAINSTLAKLYEKLACEDSPSDLARLSLWMYEPNTAEQFQEVWKAFGHSAWVETVPKKFIYKVAQTRQYIEERIRVILPLLHEVSCSTYGQRKSSPLTLPLRNFDSSITKDLKKYWYNELEKPELSKRIMAFKMRYSQVRVKEKNGYRDDRNLLFKPAKDTECHGQPHPTGQENKSFICGKFRYGVALAPGFHFDVHSQNSSTIQSQLKTSSGATREMRSEKRIYINIFPNDHLLPE